MTVQALSKRLQALETASASNPGLLSHLEQIRRQIARAEQRIIR